MGVRLRVWWATIHAMPKFPHPSNIKSSDLEKNGVVGNAQIL